MPTLSEPPLCCCAVRVVDVGHDPLRLARRAEREACVELVRQAHGVVHPSEIHDVIYRELPIIDVRFFLYDVQATAAPRSNLKNVGAEQNWCQSSCTRKCWVYVNNGDESKYNVRGRFVGKELKPQRRKMHLHASFPAQCLRGRRSASGRVEDVRVLRVRCRRVDPVLGGPLTPLFTRRARERARVRVLLDRRLSFIGCRRHGCLTR